MNNNPDRPEQVPADPADAPTEEEIESEIHNLLGDLRDRMRRDGLIESDHD